MSRHRPSTKESYSDETRWVYYYRQGKDAAILLAIGVGLCAFFAAIVAAEEGIPYLEAFAKTMLLIGGIVAVLACLGVVLIAVATVAGYLLTDFAYDVRRWVGRD